MTTEKWWEIADFETNCLYSVKEGKCSKQSPIPYIFFDDWLKDKIESGEVKIICIRRER